MNEFFGLDTNTAAKGGGVFISLLVLLRWLVSWTRKQDTIDATSKGLQDLLEDRENESKKWKKLYENKELELEIMKEREYIQQTKLALMRMSLIHHGIDEEFIDMVLAKEFPKHRKEHENGANSSTPT